MSEGLNVVAADVRVIVRTLCATADSPPVCL